MATRVLHLMTSLDVGGIEQYLLRVLQYMPAADWDNHVLCKSGQTGQLEREYIAAGATVRTCHQGYFRPSEFRRLFRIMKDGRYDAVCDFTGDFAGIPLYLAHQADIPIRIAFYRVSVRAFRKDPVRLMYISWVRSLVKHHATRILSNSIAAFDSFYPESWVGDSRFEVVRNGIPRDECVFSFDEQSLRRELKIAPGKLVIGHVGRYADQKNHTAILRVAQHIGKQRDDVVFLLVGNGVTEHVAPRAASLGLGNMICSPARRDIPRVLRLMDAFYFPSLYEGLPNALLEAMLAGVPFVASDIATIKECVPAEFHEWLVEPREIDQASRLLLEHVSPCNVDTIRRKCTQLAGHIREEFSPDRCFSQFLRALHMQGSGRESRMSLPNA